MSEEALVIGYVVLAIITLGSFVGLILKFTQPINELRIVIQKLNDNIDVLKSDNASHNTKIEKHGQDIANLDNRVGQLETKMDMYHEG